MSSFFASNLKAFSKAVELESEGKLDTLLSNLVASFIFKDEDEALADFAAAVKTAQENLAAKGKADFIASIQKKMDGYTLPKGLMNIFAQASEDAEDVGIESIRIVFSIKLDEDGKTATSIKVYDPASIKATKAKTASGIKATIKGEAITKAMVIKNWPNSIAARILKANGCPVGIVNRKNGQPYSDSTRFSAANAVKLDPELKQLID